MKKLLPVAVLEKYVNGTCTDAERVLVEEWYASFENEPDADLNTGEVIDARSRIYQNILNSADLKRQTPVRSLSLKKWYGWAAAASVVLALGVTLLAHVLRTKNGTVAVAKTNTVENKTGQILRTALPDGSVVWLEPHAQISYPKQFSDASRNISMKGECFFEVTKNPIRPFIISSRHIVTKVWGTSFLVRDNEVMPIANVSVMTGKVSVSIKKSERVLPKVEAGEVMLYPNQKVTYLGETETLQTRLNQPDLKMHIWDRVNLSFTNKQLGEIIPVLNATFHVHIKANNTKLTRYVLNADMDGFNLPEILETFKKVLNVNYKIDDSNIELV
ncbi:FecR family protein [Mucilaginibacter ginkgonis]|uniref:FecR family protein n=1 Tax=Mucilaginibacter ginkgonis TaxID=2682091 RepID=A0A6I4I0Z3_9SPHI|nr:FecR family protein [Mucilaginibacter ginkgonis]QQL50470.1 FecR family protein [Mucilaginibacter ginkgonis]